MPILVILQRFLHLISGLKPDFLQFQNVGTLARQNKEINKKIGLIIRKKAELQVLAILRALSIFYFYERKLMLKLSPLGWKLFLHKKWNLFLNSQR